jgi:hypothetical protein
LNSSLKIDRVDSGFARDIAGGRAMEMVDRSYLYPEFHVAMSRLRETAVRGR